MTAPRDSRLLGVNLVGYLRAESGVGQLGRSWLATLDAGEIGVARLTYGNTRVRQEHELFGPDAAAPFYDVNLVSINADQVPVFVADGGRDLLAGRYSIGIWAWEVEEFPEAMARSEEHLQEVWALSHHAAEAIRRRVRIPVHAVQPSVDPPPPESPPIDLGERTGGPRFLCCFDYESVVERKNPEGAIRAFTAAFAPGDGAQLLVKSVNGHLHPDELTQVRAAAAGRRDVRFHDGYLSPRQQVGLLDACDAFVSLHRAEGFGLMLAEAMWLGKPVVATAYSGNLDFMDDRCSLLVPWRRVAIGPGQGPYSGGWAEPSLEAAASGLRRVAAEPDWARELGERGRAAVRSRLSPAARADDVRRRLEALPAMEQRPLGDSLEALRHRVRRGADPAVPALLGPLGRVLRRAALRMVRHGSLHQREVDLGLLREIAALERRLADLERLGRHREYLAEGLRRRLRRAEERAGAEPSGDRAG
jgi:glycosyltransferase involved in cell wall biosynthesis